ncbi:hypothetical protein [Promicromonospora panici]|uniref:hypothetical protein n=1 Tax=Promicromonospora panici TaxID=2219658 RepID=UPI00101E0D4B|nr:hypothetical protein [Promicromonospora panici]
MREFEVPPDPGAPPYGEAPPPDSGALPVTGAGSIGTILAAALFLTLAGGLLSRGAARLRGRSD